jgi:hypothetical protein
VTTTFVVQLFRNVCHLNHCCAKDDICLGNLTHAHIPPLYATVSGGLPCGAVRTTNRTWRRTGNSKSTSYPTTTAFRCLSAWVTTSLPEAQYSSTESNYLHFRTKEAFKMAHCRAVVAEVCYNAQCNRPRPCSIRINTMLTCKYTAPLAVDSKAIRSVVRFLHVAVRD